MKYIAIHTTFIATSHALDDMVDAIIGELGAKLADMASPTNSPCRSGSVGWPMPSLASQWQSWQTLHLDSWGGVSGSIFTASKESDLRTFVKSEGIGLWF